MTQPHEQSLEASLKAIYSFFSFYDVNLKILKKAENQNKPTTEPPTKNSNLKKPFLQIR